VNLRRAAEFTFTALTSNCVKSFVIGLNKMPTIRFLGEIRPREFIVSVDRIPTVQWRADEIDLQMTFSFRIQASRVTVECEVSRYAPDCLVAIWMRALDLSRGVVSLLGYAHGVGATVLLDTLINPDGEKTGLFAHDERLNGILHCLQPQRHGRSKFLQRA
jgi:hypothetical protein